jgi:hypothetical protein
LRPKDIKDPFLACKLVVLDEMANTSHKKLYMTDFMELVLRVSVLRYPLRPMAVPEIVKSLQKLFLNHFYKHEALLDQFCSTVDQALVKDRVEAFASAIVGHRRREDEDEGSEGVPTPSNRRPSGKGSAKSRRTSQAVDSADEGKPATSDAARSAEVVEKEGSDMEKLQPSSSELQPPQSPKGGVTVDTSATDSCEPVDMDTGASPEEVAAISEDL